MSKFIDLTGKQFGKRTVIKLLELVRYPCGSVARLWLVRCICGKETATTPANARNGYSCGCVRDPGKYETRRLPPGESARRNLLRSYKTTADKRGHCWKLTDEQFNLLISRNCYYCDVEPKQVHTVRGNYTQWVSSKTYNGIDRVDNSRGYEADNVVPCCHVCNWAKRTMEQDTFISWIHRVARTHPQLNTQTVQGDQNA